MYVNITKDLRLKRIGFIKLLEKQITKETKC